MNDHHVISDMPLLFIYDPGVRQLQELHAGGEVGGEEGDISRGIMLESSQYPRPVCDSVTQDC